MRRTDYDVIVVGARCAGATLATLLARSGARVLLLDAQALPSDHVISTHSINPPGIDVLDEVGVGDEVRAVTPPTRIIRAALDRTWGEIELPPGRAVYCPRRERLDGLLQRAAVAAGAELIDRARVVSVIERDGRACGVRARGAAGEWGFSAPLVIGADGRRSTVARAVGAEEYLGYDAPRACYWGYWKAPAFWRTDARYRFDAYFSIVSGVVRVVFQTDHDHLLIGSCPPAEQTGPWRADPEGMLQQVIAGDPLIAPLTQGTLPVGRVRGTVKERYFFRTGAGNGWALVGDAGHHKEFSVGDGITEALLQARSLATAIGCGSDAALRRWWRARDVEALPLYFLGREFGAVAPPPELHRLVFERLDTTPGLRERLVEVMERRCSPLDTIPALEILRWAGLAVLRGRVGILGELGAMGPRALGMARELRARSRLLAAAERHLARDARAVA